MQATYAPILKREDGQVDWALSAPQIRNQMRGFTPFPGCYSFVQGQKLEITNCAAEDCAQSAEAGTVIEVGKESLVVICGAQSQLRITEVLPAGKRVMPARDFLNGAKLTVGVKLG